MPARVYRDIADRLTAIPGVQSVVSTNRLPLGRGPTNTLVIDGYVSPTGTNTTEVSGAAVSANYFDALGIRILHGRAFRPQDNFTAPPVAIVSEAMARRYWGTSDVVGRRYRHDGVPEFIGGDRRRRERRQGGQSHRRPAAAVLSPARSAGRIPRLVHRQEHGRSGGDAWHAEPRRARSRCEVASAPGDDDRGVPDAAVADSAHRHEHPGWIQPHRARSLPRWGYMPSSPLPWESGPGKSASAWRWVRADRTSSG